MGGIVGQSPNGDILYDAGDGQPRVLPQSVLTSFGVPPEAFAPPPAPQPDPESIARFRQIEAEKAQAQAAQDVAQGSTGMAEFRRLGGQVPSVPSALSPAPQPQPSGAETFMRLAGDAPPPVQPDRDVVVDRAVPGLREERQRGLIQDGSEEAILAAGNQALGLERQVEEARYARATAEAAAAQKMAGEKQRLAAERAQAYETLEKARHEQVGAQMERLAAAQDALRKAADIDPNRLYKNMSGASKVAFLVGVGLDGLTRAYYGGRNQTLEMVERMAEQDIDAQKANYQKKKDLVGAEQNMYGQLVNHFKDEQTAVDVLKSAQLERAAAEYEAALAKLSPDRVTEDHLKALAEMKGRAAEFGAAAQKRQLDKANTEFNQNMQVLQHNETVRSHRANEGIQWHQEKRADDIFTWQKSQADRQFMLDSMEQMSKFAEKNQVDPALVINGTGTGVKVKGQDMWIGRSKEAVDKYSEGANMKATAVRIADEILAMGEIERRFPGSQTRELRKQKIKQMLSFILQAGGRSISDKDVGTIEKAIGSDDPDQMLRWASNDTIMKKIKAYRQETLESMRLDATTFSNARYEDVTIDPPPITVIERPSDTVKGGNRLVDLANVIQADSLPKALGAMEVALNEVQSNPTAVKQGFPVTSQGAAKAFKTKVGAGVAGFDQIMEYGLQRAKESNSPSAIMAAEDAMERYKRLTQGETGRELDRLDKEQGETRRKMGPLYPPFMDEAYDTLRQRASE